MARGVCSRRCRSDRHHGLLAYGAGYPADGWARLGCIHLPAARLAATRADKGLNPAILIIEQVGEDGHGETRIVELEREIGSAFVRLLRPADPDLGATDEHPVARALPDANGSERSSLLLRYGFSLFAWSVGRLAQDLPGQPRLLPRILFGADPRPLFG